MLTYVDCLLVPCQIIMIHVDIMLKYVNLCSFPYILSEGFLCVCVCFVRRAIWDTAAMLIYVDFKLILYWSYVDLMLSFISDLCWFYVIFYNGLMLILFWICVDVMEVLLWCCDDVCRFLIMLYKSHMDLCWFMSILCWLMLIVCWFHVKS